ncbi:MAG: aminotransferase class I/II-fold pyridoxal phosphate-dependent enzyme [Tyzzerella sp.]|uniref:Aminotransferase n=1 Tax=Candidatus Fimicola merdigallinarum TaxID=2840819 RepID=A0A9D9DY30_9FIRM|nr:aminotransferase class I/II-fold pyridoxal phosphate-dependent enzyme [Candidatus Fimicola merdigallinarum]
MPTSGIRKFFDIVSTMEDVVSLGVGEPDFETPWHVREEAISSIEKGRTAYTSNQGMINLRQAISDYLYNKYNIKYDAESEVLVTVGASEGIDLSLRAICNSGDEILVVEPSYVSYKPCIVMAGGVPVVVETKEENDFRLTVDDIKEKITDKAKAIIFPYPNNPTGAIMEKKDLEAIADIIIENDLIVISDEIYSELTYDGHHVSIASLPNMWDRTIVLNGFSKSFAMTGWRLGYAVAPKKFIEQMTKIHQYIIMCAPTMSQYAGLDALTNEYRDEDIDIMRESYNERRKVMVEGFRKMGLSCFEPKGAFYVFPCIKSTGLTSEEFCEKLLYDEKVAVVPGTAFGECGEGFIRCSYAYSVDSIRLALERIERFVNKIREVN